MEVLEKVSRAIAADYGITVTFAGARAFTDCKHINLPNIPPELINDESIDLLRGYCDHEIAHVLYSCRDILKSKEFNSASPEVELLTGIIEDIRVEKEMSKKYAGARVNLERLAEMLVPDTNLKHPFGALIIEGRNKVCGFDVNCEGREKLASALCTFFKEPMLFEKIAATKSSQDSFELAKELIDSAKQQEPPPPEEQEGPEEQEEGGGEGSGNEGNEGNEGSGGGGNEGNEGSGNEGNEGNEGSGGGGNEGNEGSGDEGNEGNEGSNGSGNEGNEGSGGEGSGGEGVGEESIGAGDFGNDGKGDSSANCMAKGNTESDGMFDGAGDAFAKAEMVGNSLDTKIKDFLKGAGDELRKRGSYRVYSTSYDEIVNVKEEHGGKNRYEVMRSELGNIGHVKSKIATLFNTRVAGHWMLGKERGRVNNRALCGVESGRRDVFKERFTCNDVDTAITFLIDLSGSMSSHDKIGVAMRTTAMFSEILQATKVKFEILGFTSGGPINIGGNLTQDEISEEYIVKGNMCRTEILSTYVFKSFAEPMNASIKARIGSYGSIRMRNNYDGENLLIAFKRLMKRKESRKILFVLSDGAPCGNNYSNEGQKYLKHVAENIETKSSVELIGIGYMSNDVCRFYKNHILVNKAMDLPPMMLKELKRILKVA